MDCYKQKTVDVSILEPDEAYRKGYLLGYRAGYQDGKSGKNRIVFEMDSVATYPIEVLGLSTRAYNCLRIAGCRYAADVAKLEEGRIRRMRNLGKLTAAEIAQTLIRFGIHGTEWEYYLL